MDDSSLEKVAGGFEATEHTIHVTGSNYYSVIASAPTVLIMFGAMWAYPSKMLRETLETFASQTENVTVGIVDVDGDEALCAHLNVRQIPTTIKYLMGVEAERIIGYQPLDTWTKLL